MASKRLLIVDDEENIGRSLRMILEREGYAVNVCRSAAEFRRHPDADRADVYLFDIKLPDGNGIELLKAVRQNAAAAPAIFSKNRSAAIASWWPSRTLSNRPACAARTNGSANSSAAAPG